MKKILFFIMLVFSVITFSCSSDDENNQTNYPEKIHEGSVILKTQIQVDEFGSHNYTKIYGALTIESQSNLQKIEDLTPLQSIKFVSSRLSINYNETLKTLNGLNSLKTVGERVYISGNDELLNLNALNNLSEIGSFLYISYNPKIQTLNGLNTLNSLTGLYIEGNDLLNSLSGLDNLTNFEGTLKIQGNENLKNFCPIKVALTNSTNSIIYPTISNNYFNPSIQDIINGNCSN